MSITQPSLSSFNCRYFLVSKRFHCLYHVHQNSTLVKLQRFGMICHFRFLKTRTFLRSSLEYVFSIMPCGKHSSKFYLIRYVTWNISLTPWLLFALPMRGVEYCDERIYLWVCLYVCISVRLHISRSSSSGIAICYVLLVLWITSHLPFRAFHCQCSDVTASYWVRCIQWLAAPRLDESIVQGVLMNHCLVVDHFCCTRDFVIILLQPFNGLFSRTTWVSQYQKGKTNLDFTGARDSEWQWHQLGHMQVCTSLQTDNHASTPPLCFFTGQMPFLPPNKQRQGTES